MDKKRKICTIIAIILTLIFACVSFGLATEMQGTSGYITDETWYVSSARNILREVFGVQPSYVDSNGGQHYTVFFSTHFNMKQAEESFRDFIRREFNGDVTDNYEKANAISIATQEKLDYEAVLKNFAEVKTIQSGFRYPDVYNVEDYKNTEHPPLVKYILGFSMLALGDQPANWRIPSIIAGSLALLIVYLMTAKLVNNDFIALFVYLFAFTDPIIRGMSSVAMLDVYVAFFMAMSAYLALRGNYFLSALAIGLASSCKLTGIFAIGGLFFFMVFFRKSSVKKSIFFPFVVPFLVWFLFNSPLIIEWGFQGWIRELESGLRWLATSRPVGAPVSAPWGWFVNENPFPLNINPNVSASVNPTIYIAAIITLISTPYLARKINRDYTNPAFWFIFTFAGFLFVYVLGNRTMYSFYAVTLAPMAYVLASILIHHIIDGFTKQTETKLPILKKLDTLLFKRKAKSRARRKTPKQLKIKRPRR